ncbi:hypothetical protein [Polaromonas jejuensis]|uniref:Uncharacterized protein n=1 Tax=Polaromonas jejuensis TaxID=457502 RepID=A0ABW0QAG0_9BURK|nr:hypothetical protein [Polaromonas jejuensis]
MIPKLLKKLLMNREGAWIGPGLSAGDQRKERALKTKNRAQLLGPGD